MTTPDALQEAVRAALEQNIGVGTVDARTRDAIIANVLGAFDRSALALTTTPLAGEVGWLPIGSAELWGLYVVTDGKWAAVSQLAEADDGSRYWAVDPEDGLDWEPTHCMPLPGAAPTPSNIGDAEAREALEAITQAGPERDIKWAGMTARDIALFTLAKLSGAGDGLTSEARLLANLFDVDPIKWSGEEVRRLFDLVNAVAAPNPPKATCTPLGERK